MKPAQGQRPDGIDQRQGGAWLHGAKALGRAYPRIVASASLDTMHDGEVVIIESGGIAYRIRDIIQKFIPDAASSFDGGWDFSKPYNSLWWSQ